MTTLADPITGAVATALAHAQQVQASTQWLVGVTLHALEADVATLVQRHKHGLTLNAMSIARAATRLDVHCAMIDSARAHVERLTTLQAAIDAARKEAGQC